MSILLLLKALFTCGWTDGIAVQIAAAALVLLPYLAWSKTTLLTNLALCTLYACWHMTLPDTGSQAQLSERGLSPSAVHAHGCALKNLSLVAQTVQTAMLQLLWQEGRVSLKEALCQATAVC